MSEVRRLISVLRLVVVLGVAFVTGLGAQGEEEFVPIQPGDLVTENLPATPLVFAAYAAVWVALLIYVFVLWQRLTRVERELAEVTSKLESRSP
jgi:CcmD family protein